MAQRRMFSKRVTNSGRFLTMPPSSQNLYFHLGMEADDDGVVDAHSVMKITDSKPDDFNVLIAKKFIYQLNEDLVVVILDWREHNLIRADRKIDSIYKELLKEKLPQMQLLEAKIRADVIGRPVDNQMSAQVRLGKVRIGKDRLSNTAETSSAGIKENYNPLGSEIIKAFEGVDPKNKKYYGNTTQRKACDFLLEEYGLEEVLKRISVLSKTNKVPYFPTITTPVQLRDKWVALQDAVDRKRGELKTKKEILI